MNVSQKRSRGRPMQSPEKHRVKLNGKISKKQKKTIQNNISSIVYRRKKAEEQRIDQIKLEVEQARNTKLREQYEKLENIITQLKLMVK